MAQHDNRSGFRYQFVKDPSRGVFLDIIVSVGREDRPYALKALKELVKKMEKMDCGSPALPDHTVKDGVCFAEELVDLTTGTSFILNVTMQDGRRVEPRMKPDGTCETPVETIGREWEESEIKRAVMGLDEQTRPDEP